MSPLPYTNFIFSKMCVTFFAGLLTSFQYSQVLQLNSAHVLSTLCYSNSCGQEIYSYSRMLGAWD
jgi:hypothetical protein